MGGQRVNQTIKSFIEPFPHKIAEIGDLLSSVSQEEQAIEANRRNRGVRQQHERQAENLRRQLLAQADYSLVYNYMEATGIAGKNAFRTTWQQNLSPVENTDWLEFVQSYSLDLASLPFGSFYIQFAFKLLKPYISRDDNQFYIVDNPIVREKVFRLPMVRPTAWKGSLRHALWQLGYQKEDKQIKRLFGTANDDQPEQGNNGRLYFYPSFFTQAGLEIINPHDRERRVGKNPILMETVPIGATATFTLLYTPLDRIGRDETETRQQVIADLQRVAEGLQALFTLYGFGAKTSSGFGLADGTVRDGAIVVGGLAYESASPTPDTASLAPPQPDLPRYLVAPGRLHPDFVSETGDLKSETEYQQLIEEWGQKYAKKDKQLYAKAKGWWEREGQQLAQQPEGPEAGLEPILKAPPSYPLARETFDTLADLPAKAQKLTAALRQTGGDV
jgi:CRISPR-associated protein Cmr2